MSKKESFVLDIIFMFLYIEHSIKVMPEEDKLKLKNENMLKFHGFDANHDNGERGACKKIIEENIFGEEVNRRLEVNSHSCSSIKNYEIMWEEYCRVRGKHKLGNTLSVDELNSISNSVVMYNKGY